MAMTHRVLGSPDEDPDANSMSRSTWGRIVWNQEQSGTLGGLALGPILTPSGPSKVRVRARNSNLWAALQPTCCWISQTTYNLSLMLITTGVWIQRTMK